MIANFHTHSSFCDGKNTPEEIILAAIDKGFYAIGFSGHGYTEFDLRYCLKDTNGYILETYLFFDHNEYNQISEKYITEAAESNCIFEINTGAIARGLRTTPYPAENLLYVLKEKDAKILLSSDSHSIDTLDFAFEEIKQYLYDIGFRYLHTLTKDSEFVRYNIQ